MREHPRVWRSHPWASGGQLAEPERCGTSANVACIRSANRSSCTVLDVMATQHRRVPYTCLWILHIVVRQSLADCLVHRKSSTLQYTDAPTSMHPHPHATHALIPCINTVRMHLPGVTLLALSTTTRKHTDALTCPHVPSIHAPSSPTWSWPSR